MTRPPRGTPPSDGGGNTPPRQPRRRPAHDDLERKIRRAIDQSASPAAGRGGQRSTANPSARRPRLRPETTTLWSFPSQHYDDSLGRRMQGSRDYAGATPSWVIWQLLQRYTRPGETVVDPMCGSGTTLDVAADLGRTGLGFDLAPTRPDISQADARELPLDEASADFVFVDPPYSTHIDYSDDPRCIGKLDAGEGARARAGAGPRGPADGPPGPGGRVGDAYYTALEEVIDEMHRVLRPDRYAAVYVSDSWRKHKGRGGGQAGGQASGQGGGHGRRGGPRENSARSPRGPGQAGREPPGLFMPIGFELFDILRDYFEPVDLVAVARQNTKLGRGNWHQAAERENFFLRGFNHLMIVYKR